MYTKTKSVVPVWRTRQYIIMRSHYYNIVFYIIIIYYMRILCTYTCILCSLYQLEVHRRYNIHNIWIYTFTFTATYNITLCVRAVLWYIRATSRSPQIKYWNRRFIVSYRLCNMHRTKLQIHVSDSIGVEAYSKTCTCTK